MARRVMVRSKLLKKYVPACPRMHACGSLFRAPPPGSQYHRVWSEPAEVRASQSPARVYLHCVAGWAPAFHVFRVSTSVLCLEKDVQCVYLYAVFLVLVVCSAGAGGT